MNPIVIEPANFDQNAAWKECETHVENCGGFQHRNGRTNWRAAHGADPGVCSCPMCGTHYWAWGVRQRCVSCGFEYPTDWWPMYSWGVSNARKIWNHELHDSRMNHLYYRYGFEHPVPDAWTTCHTPEWKNEIRNLLQTRPGGAA